MVGFKRWIRNKSRSKERRNIVPTSLVPTPFIRNPEPIPRDSLPFRPPQRRCMLTPTPSREHLVSPLSNYGFFTNVPYEVRRGILIEAFGDQTLHLDLSYDCPLVRKVPQVSTRHCGLGTALVRDRSMRQSWQWFSCVCHRYNESDFRIGGERLPPHEDSCLAGLWCDCGIPDGGSRNGKCFIGVMGWLLSCRQAYVDCMDVLFSTNTFHISSLYLQLQIPRLLLPHRLGSITSLELLWKFLNPSNPAVPEERNLSHELWNIPETKDSTFHTLCKMVPQTFPNVRRLYISLWGCIKPPAYTLDTASGLEDIFLRPIEDMLRTLGLGSEKQFKLAIPRGAWMALNRRYLDRYFRRGQLEGDISGTRRFWKSLGPSDTDSDRLANDGLGYWICAGSSDLWSCQDIVPARDMPRIWTANAIFESMNPVEYQQ